MNEFLRDMLSVFKDELPTLTSLLPIPGIASKMLGAMGQRLLNKATATEQEVAAVVKADPEKAAEALKPLDDHMAATANAAAAGAATVPAAELPEATRATVDAIEFTTDTREVVLGPIDDTGRAVLNIYLTPQQYQQIRLEA